MRIRRCADDKHHRGICTLLGVWVAGVAIPYVSWLDATRTSPSRKVERKMLPPGCWLPATRNLPRQTTGHHQGGRREQTPGVLEENCQIRQTHRVHLTTGVPSPRDDKTQRSTHPRNHVTKTYPTGGSLEFEAPASIFFGRHGNAPHYEGVPLVGERGIGIVGTGDEQNQGGARERHSGVALHPQKDST